MLILICLLSLLYKFLYTKPTFPIDNLAKKVFENCDKLNRNISYNDDPLCNGIIYKKYLKKHHKIYKLLNTEINRLNLHIPKIINDDSYSSKFKEFLTYSINPSSMFKHEDLGIIKLIEKL